MSEPWRVSCVMTSGSFAESSYARQGEAQVPPLLDHWLVAKLCRWRGTFGVRLRYSGRP
ncbi:hypothetical protein DDI_4458 [Dickeya dianthicola RNS04.9]|nr:hypothetical protein DDI_4458 [Dickeya dianthicola RNS04.9]